MAGRFFKGARTLAGLFAVYARLDLLWFLRDTRYCLLQMAADAVSAAAAVTGVFLVAARLGGFGGMDRAQVLFMLSLALFTDGLFSLFFAGNNAANISRVIGRGQLDHCMAQPVPLWMQLVSCGFCPFSGCSTLLCGTALVIYAAHAAHLCWTPGAALLFLLFALCACVVSVSASYLVSCLAFYAPAAAEEIAPVVNELFSSLKPYPLGSLSGVWRGILCTLLPVGLGAWYPAELLLHGAPGAAPYLLPPVIAALFAAAAVFTFQKGMKHYAIYACPRYSGFGHR